MGHPAKGSYNGYSVTASYGQYSTPESIASNLAALITKQYSNSGLSAQANGANILYKSTAPLGAANFSTSASSFTANPSPTACPPANLKYILAVQSDTVIWKAVDNSAGQRGRQITYEIANWPKAGQTGFRSLTFPSYTNADITEHLTANGYTSSNFTADGVYRHSGQFGDVLGTGSLTNGFTGAFRSNRWFSVILDGTPVPGSVMTFDKAGKHSMDYIEIYLPTGPSFLNSYKNPDGTPKDISLATY